MCAFSMVLSPLWKPRLITLTEKVTGERGALCPAIPRQWWASDNGQAGSRTHRRKWMGEKYKKERGGEGKKGKQSSLFLLSTRFAAQPLRPLLSLSLSFCLSLPPPSSTPYGRQSRSKDDRPILLFRFICRSEMLLFRIVARFNGLIYFARFSLANRLDPVDH